MRRPSSPCSGRGAPGRSSPTSARRPRRAGRRRRPGRRRASRRSARCRGRRSTAPPNGCSSYSRSSATAARTSSAEASTSGPIPSPGRVTIVGIAAAYLPAATRGRPASYRRGSESAASSPPGGARCSRSAVSPSPPPPSPRSRRRPPPRLVRTSLARVAADHRQGLPRRALRRAGRDHPDDRRRAAHRGRRGRRRLRLGRRPASAAAPPSVLTAPARRHDVAIVARATRLRCADQRS